MPTLHPICCARRKTHVLEFQNLSSFAWKSRQKLRISKKLLILGCNINYTLEIRKCEIGEF